jgi:predicted DNA-binding protein (MmcQ/YjbR family)
LIQGIGIEAGWVRIGGENEEAQSMALAPGTGADPRIDAVARSLPAVTHVAQWGDHDVYKVGGKIFAVAGDGLSLKVSDIGYEMLTHSGAAKPAPYMARNKWVLFEDPKALSKAELKDHLTNAHAIVAGKLTKKLKAQLGLS